MMISCRCVMCSGNTATDRTMPGSHFWVIVTAKVRKAGFLCCFVS